MLFSEKLDFLMKITNTTNSSLARNVSLDPSYISRLRRGLRTPAKNENYLKSMATYFSKNCHEDYQKEALLKALNIPSKSLIKNNDKLTELLYQWLSDKQEDAKKSINSFLEDISHFKFKKAKPHSPIDELDTPDGISTDGQVYYGIEGKRNAVITFLSRILKNKNPQTLLLYSNEDMEWLTGDPSFTYKWASLLSKALMKGNRIKIIHTVNRSLDEMFSAIKEWLPIYMTGLIEPYYYPKARDKVFRRTLFIAPDTAAVISSSIENKTEKTPNFLYTDKDTINALVEEYNSYLSLCRPLMKIFTSANKKNYLSTLAEFENENGNSIIKTNVFSIVTMPMGVAKSILSAVDNDTKEQILLYHKKRIENFKNSLKRHEFTEIITLPDIETILKGEVKVYFSHMLVNQPLFYTPQEFIEHLENILQILETYKNYNIYIETGSKPSDYMLYVKEDVGVIVAKTSVPSVVFAINESNMTATFWNYMNSTLGKIGKSKSQKEAVSDILKKIIKMYNKSRVT